MAVKTLYTCSECSYESAKWVGRCPNCEKWNTFTEQTRETTSRKHRAIEAKSISTLKLNPDKGTSRLMTNIQELDRTLGGGFMLASCTLLGGEPGIGKSTITLQLAQQISQQDKKLIYISGEESLHQVAERAQRMKIATESIFFLPENNLETIIATLEKEKPDFVIIDSIQTVSSFDLPGSPGSISQTITATERLIEHCKTNNITLLLIGHVTKEGSLAGPKMLEHLVDTVLLLEGDRYHQYRLLRTSKNRFGSTNEIGIFAMEGSGMVEVKNPSAQFLEGREKEAIGSVFTVTMEGNRPLLIEVQALTNHTPFGYPKRTANGFDLNRLHILVAVLEKYSKVKLQDQDIFINVAGGFKLNDPASDLAVALAIISSFYKIPISSSFAALGEMGLSGEIKPIMHLASRIKELEKLGIQKVALPEISMKKLTSKLTMQGIKKISETILK